MKTKRQFSREFKQQAVRLVGSGDVAIPWRHVIWMFMRSSCVSGFVCNGRSAPRCFPFRGR